MEEDVRLSHSEERDGCSNGREETASVGFSPQQNGSLGKSQVRTGEQSSSPFHRLPRTVIEHILYRVDANTFASLALLNRKWRRISDSSQLYAHHLSHCLSFSLTQKATSDMARSDGLPSLKRKFMAEIRRNAFDVFLRPRRTLIKLISTSMSSSTPFPQGEAFRFTFSPNAQLILCISSSRIVVIDVASGPTAVVRHELKTWRRPLNAAISDDGCLLAVVSSSHQVHIYSLSDYEATHIQELQLHDVPRALALCPTGGVLSIAYDDRIEVYAIREGALATERRAVRCTGVDAMSFSSDGIMLLGTSTDEQNSELVTVTVPFYTEPEADSTRDAQIRMWTTQILFPDVLRGYSHACLVPMHAEGEGNWIMGFDKEIGAFRAIGANSAHSGTTYFVNPMSPCGSQESPPTMLPTVDCEGELVAVGFQDAGLWVYGLPDRLDIAPRASSHTAPNDGEDGQMIEELATSRQDSLMRLQQSILRPKMLISGHKMCEVPGITAARWVQHPTGTTTDRRRLAAVAPGGVNPPTIGDEDVPVDGGRVVLLDFERSCTDGDVTEFSIEIGESEPKMLNEPNASMDIAVELERRRTLLNRGHLFYGRHAARESYPSASSAYQLSTLNLRRNSSYLSSSSNEFGEGDYPPIPESPYDNTQPRSHDTLRRAATAAAFSRGRYNPRYRNEGHRVYDDRRVPALFQIPHESDADNWVPPPPPYSREPDAPLPEHLRRSLLPTATRGVPQIHRSQTTRMSSTSEESSTLTTLQRLNTVTGSRFSSRMRRNTRDSEDRNRRHSSLVRWRANSLGRLPRTTDEPDIPPVPSDLDASPDRPQTADHTPSLANRHNQAVSVVEETHAPVQESPHQADQLEPEAGNPTQEDAVDQEDFVPALPTMAPNLNYPFSLSSPNLQAFDSPYEGSEVMRNTWLRPGQRRSVDRRSQSQDIRMSPAGIPPLNRRASTDPTLSVSSQPSNDLWRRRIEEWNERTVYERSKKRSKCIVM
ncbi:hypothetical protein EYZ11_004094 [Aspergillus tanneri]|uniref:F-box domain-containing protein n=1 Tax=Aspergillus tanneri TaxID=1220188 RepID=A0A4S3JLW6_9EURO|nr:uncharacterized protein ATNIH1004_006031 [Aspergillus tanneri]KAA8647339.1 hypothetical protein ATNIH1004_006031 [Aspergillus tanneri]THC96445.1 hypothetical protein EYZ11_004094 [Aspergillus tanneri]